MGLHGPMGWKELKPFLSLLFFEHGYLGHYLHFRPEMYNQKMKSASLNDVRAHNMFY